ncbi:MAG: hypothetical protein Q8Q09_10950 [Deltaproteobacteria bacterium]|nr:hypothetical protein [Deltaproteobacteria bacterium]
MRSFIIDPLSPALSIDPVARIDLAAAPSFDRDGNLVLIERQWDQGLLVIHRARAGAGWQRETETTLKGFRSAPVGVAVDPTRGRIAAGMKTAKLFEEGATSSSVSFLSVKYQLEWCSLGFSPSGASLAIGDGGYVAPKQRNVHVCDASTGEKRATIKTDEWHFSHVAMLDDDLVVCRGLAFDWDFDDAERSGEQVIACYDVATKRARWRRAQRTGQCFSVDNARKLTWLTTETAPFAWDAHVAIDADGTIAYEIKYSGGYEPSVSPPVAVGSSLLVLSVTSRDAKHERTLVLDVEAQRVVATLNNATKMEFVERPPAVHADTARFAAVCERNHTLLWELAQR